MSILLRCLPVGYLPTNCYVLACEDTQEAIVIDPGTKEAEENRIIGAIEHLKLNLEFIACTHGHPDHTAGNKKLKQITGADILIHERDAPLLTNPWLGAEESPAFKVPHRCPICGKQEMVRLDIDGEKARTISGCGVVVWEAEISPPADKVLSDGDIISFGQTELKVIHTPGHTAGGISLYSADERMVFTGDTLSSGSHGRTDLARGSEEDMKLSLRKLMQLPTETVVYPGHGDSTTIGKERIANPYVQSL
jgi:hydroxyacylglutathione hydrolase